MVHRAAPRIAAVLAASLLLALGGCRRKPEAAPAADTLLQRSLVVHAARGRIGTLHWPDFSDYKPQVVRFYEQRRWTPGAGAGRTGPPPARPRGPAPVARSNQVVFIRH